MKHRSSGKMPSAVPNAYAGGYSESIKRQLENVVLPDKIKCNTCKKFRMQSAFSKRQLDGLCNAIVVLGQSRALNAGQAKCRTCVGGQTVELRCCICDKTKSLEEFAKNQRHEHDSARCINCVQGHCDTEPVLEEQKLLMEGDFSTIQDSLTTSQLDNTSTAEASKRLLPSNTLRYPYGGSAYGDEGDNNNDNFSVNGGVWVEPERSEESSKKGKGIEFSAYNPQGRLHHLTKSPSEAGSSVHSGWASWGINVEPSKKYAVNANLAAAAQAKKRNARFPKVPGKRFEKHEAPIVRVPESTGETVASDDEEGDPGIEDYL